MAGEYELNPELADMTANGNAGGRESETVGKCPKCGKGVAVGKYGAYCTGRCGMVLDRALGKWLSVGQTKTLLDGGKVFLEGLGGKSGKSYSASVKLAGIRPCQYEKDGKAHSGFQFCFDFEFPMQWKG